MKKFRIVKEKNQYRIDQHHSILFGLVGWWDKGAHDLCPNIRFDKGQDALHYIKRKYPNSFVTVRYIHSEGY